jgi:hypothetical protein
LHQYKCVEWDELISSQRGFASALTSSFSDIKQDSDYFDKLAKMKDEVYVQAKLLKVIERDESE